MKVEGKRTVEITLTLNEREGEWLKELTQNFLGGDFNDEPEADRRMRTDLFNALADALGHDVPGNAVKSSPEKDPFDE